MSDIIDIGASKLDPDTNVLLVQAKASQMGDDENDAPSFDDTPTFGQLGVTARPYRKTDEGNVQGVVDTSLPGSNGAVTSMRDARAACAKIVEELGEGETALHSTGDGFDARVFCKDQMVAIIVGDDVAVVIDRKNKQITSTAFGTHIEQSQANGIAMAEDGGASFQMKGGVVCITGQIILGGRTPIAPVLFSLTPVVGLPAGPGPATPSPGVFIGG
jgi:hypothetical protein